MRILPLALLAACGPAARFAKFHAPEYYVLPTEPHGLAAVTYDSGWAGETPRPYDPLPFKGEWERPVEITVDGWVEVAPLVEGTEARLFVRRMGLFPEDLEEVVALTGGIPGRIPNELRILPFGRPLLGAERIVIADLANPFNEHPVQDGDLVLLAVQTPDGQGANYLFRTRDFGFRTRFGAGVLVRLPFPLAQGDADADLSPALAATVAVGYRPRTRVLGVGWITEQVALVSSIGIGSTAIDTNAAAPGIDDLDGAFNAALVGGGLELFDFVSAQVLVNLTSFAREGDESNLALAIGFDAVQFARFTERAAARLLRDNALRSPVRARGSAPTPP